MDAHRAQGHSQQGCSRPGAMPCAHHKALEVLKDKDIYLSVQLGEAEILAATVGFASLLAELWECLGFLQQKFHLSVLVWALDLFISWY